MNCLDSAPCHFVSHCRRSRLGHSPVLPLLRAGHVCDDQPRLRRISWKPVRLDPSKLSVTSRSSLSCGVPLRRLLKDIQAWLAINFL